MLRQLLNWFRLRSLEQDFGRELQYHIDRRIDDLTRSGLSERDARRQATRPDQFQNIAEAARSTRAAFSCTAADDRFARE